MKEKQFQLMSDWDQDYWYRVMLSNDSYNSVEHVVDVLMRIYGIDKAHATLLASQAHSTGFAECCIECARFADLHRQVMNLCGLSVELVKFPDVEKIDVQTPISVV